ncbi:phage tail domain-containing protein, partial [Oceanobacillus caeni]
MFIVYDKEMNVIPFPDGVKPLDIFISSIEKERTSDRAEGSNRKINYGSTYTDRDIELKILMKAHDTQDYRLLRNAVYAMFQIGDELYVSEKYERGKRYLICVDQRFIPERMPNNQRFAEANIVCSMPELPFAES